MLNKLFKKDNKQAVVENKPVHPKQYLVPDNGWYICAPKEFWLKKFEHRIGRILSKVRMGQQFVEEYYVPVIHNVIDYVQAMPASEYNHHSHSAGLMEHILDVMDIALVYKGNFFYSESGKETDVENESDVFAYATFIASAMHDIGKIIVDLDIVYKDSSDSQNVKVWHPQISKLNPNSYYKYRYNPHRDHKGHVHAAPTMLMSIVPPKGIIWLKQYPKLFLGLIHCIAGNIKDAGKVGQVLQFSDQESASKALLEGTNIAAKQEAGAAYSKGKKSPADIMITMLRMAIESGTLKVNTIGGAVWVSDGKVYGVSKVIVEKARELAMQSGYPALPENPVMLATMLCDSGYAHRHPQTQDAIHVIEVSTPKSESETWTQQLTFLVFDKSSLDPDNRLNLTDGNVQLVDKTETDGHSAKQQQKFASADSNSTMVSQPDVNSTEKQNETTVAQTDFSSLDIFSSTASAHFKPKTSNNGVDVPTKQLVAKGSRKPIKPVAHATTGFSGLNPLNQTVAPKVEHEQEPVAEPEREKQQSAPFAGLNPLNQTVAPKVEHEQEPVAEPEREKQQSAPISGLNPLNQNVAPKVEHEQEPVAEPEHESVTTKPNSESQRPSNYKMTREEQTRQANFVTSKRRGTPPITAAVTAQDMSFSQFRVQEELSRKREQGVSIAPSAVEFTQWLRNVVSLNLLPYNMINKYCECYYLIEGVFVATPSIVKTYNEMNEMNIDSSALISGFVKEKSIHIGTEKIRTLIIGKKRLKGLVLKYEVYGSLVDIQQLEAPKYTLIP